MSAVYLIKKQQHQTNWAHYLQKIFYNQTYLLSPALQSAKILFEKHKILLLLKEIIC